MKLLLDSPVPECVRALEHAGRWKVTNPQDSHADPRIYNGEQFRDAIRRQFNLQDAGLNLFAVFMYVMDETSREKQTVEIWPDCQPWKTVQKLCHSETNVEFRIELMVALPEEIYFEDTEPPPAIRSLLD